MNTIANSDRPSRSAAAVFGAVALVEVAWLAFLAWLAWSA